MELFPTIDNSLFIENNKTWLKYDYRTITPEGFCFTHSNNNDNLKTEDFAMMATLPRMYGETKDGKCYLKVCLIIKSNPKSLGQHSIFFREVLKKLSQAFWIGLYNEIYFW